MKKDDAIESWRQFFSEKAFFEAYLDVDRQINGWRPEWLKEELRGPDQERSKKKREFLESSTSDEAFKLIEKKGQIRLSQSAKLTIIGDVISPSYKLGVSSVSRETILRRESVNSAYNLRNALTKLQVEGADRTDKSKYELLHRLDAYIEKHETAFERSRTGRPPKFAGEMGVTLAAVFSKAGGTVRFHKKDRKNFNGPFVDFLTAVWKLMHPKGRPASARAFVEVTKKAWSAQRKGAGKV